MAECLVCGREFTAARTGRPRHFCGATCRKRASRSLPPHSLTSLERWTARDGKRPVKVDGSPASSTDSRTWARFADVRHMPHGIMLGGGLGCYDLDHVTDADAQAFIATIPEPIVYAERSMSGDGVHIFIAAEESPGWRRVVDGINVERYTRARFIAVTGRAFTI